MENWTDPAYVRMRQRRRNTWIIGVLLHFLLFVGLVLWPWFRGDLRGREARLAFGRFAACFYGGEATGEAGIALPKGDREHYAAAYLFGGADWPERCRPLLVEVAPDDAFLLFPSVRQAEADLREEVLRADDEIEALARTRGARRGRVPERPLEAVSRLMAALSEHARAVDPETPVLSEVIRFEEESRIEEPARVPLNAASDAVVTLAVRSDGVELHAMDTRGLSRTLVGGGRVSTIRVRRPGLVRGLVSSPSDPWAVLAMSVEQCSEDEVHCARRAGGVAPFVLTSSRLTEPCWLEAHPIDRVDRVVRVGAETFDVLTVTRDGLGGEVRRFPVAAVTGEVGGGETEGGAAGAGTEVAERRLAPPMSRVALETFAWGERAELLESAVVWSEVTSEGGRRFVERTLGGDGAGATIELARLDGEDPFSLGCDAGDHHVRAVGTSRAIAVVARDEGGAVRVLFEEEEGLPHALDPRDPRRDRARLVCDGEASALVLVRDRGPLVVRECDGERCGDAVELARATAFDAVRADGRTVVAWLETAADGAIHVTTVGDARAAPRIVAACFSNDEGFCGYPILAERNGRVILAAREGADVRALESTDAGRTFGPMSGIR